MAKSRYDIWSAWLLHRRFGGDPGQMKAAMEYLYQVRDKILQHANLQDGETLVDVGCGDGLIAFGALEQSNTAQVILSDISPKLLEEAQTIAQKMDVLKRTQFICASADDLSAINDESVDVVTTRSVLIYVQAKQRAFHEFYRVLKPGGRLSIFEPINQYFQPQPPGVFWGYDVTPVAEIAQKVKAVYRRLQPLDTDPMLNFDEQDLISFAEQAGFEKIHLNLHVSVKPKDVLGKWETFLRTAPNPKIPTLEEAMQETLSFAERKRFVAHLKPLVETKDGVKRSAVAYLWAVK